MKKFFLLTLVLIPKITLAHCPLCTIGAGALAVLAASLGVSTASVGVFIGAFSLALGLWLAKMIKQKYFQGQDAVVTLVVFFSTIIPIMPFIKESRSFYVSLWGGYGTVFHNTYLINLYLFGATVGALLLFISPYLSTALTRSRNERMLPYQGLVITFILIVLAGIILQITT
ncbi:MAG: hypothetical protein AAB586_01615 [Patescibacteria group bacterium]